MFSFNSFFELRLIAFLSFCIGEIIFFVMISVKIRERIIAIVIVTKIALVASTFMEFIAFFNILSDSFRETATPIAAIALPLQSVTG